MMPYGDTYAIVHTSIVTGKCNRREWLSFIQSTAAESTESALQINFIFFYITTSRLHVNEAKISLHWSSSNDAFVSGAFSV